MKNMTYPFQIFVVPGGLVFYVLVFGHILLILRRLYFNKFLFIILFEGICSFRSISCIFL